jgi:hypothetical protein
VLAVQIKIHNAVLANRSHYTLVEQRTIWTDRAYYLRRSTGFAIKCWLRAFLVGSLFVVCFQSLFATERTDVDDPPRRIVVVIPESWQASLAKWQDFRASQGYQVQMVAPGRTAEETRDAIRIASEANSKPIEFIVLAADSPDFRDSMNDTSSLNIVPTFYVDSNVVVHFGSTPTIASDHPYSDWRKTGKHETVVGRIPARSAKELEEYCDRVIRYETANSFNGSNRQVDVVAGVGGFGAITDTVVESMARQLLSEDIPREYQLSMMQASPSSVYYPNPLLFSQTALERINRGGLLWIYLGHGFVDTLDMIPFGDQLLPILTKDQLPQVNVKGLPPVAVFLACYLGAFDAGGGCLAEKMVMQTGGPIAVIAGSRVTMPYGMGILGGGMLEATFRDQKSTIGEILLHAKQASVAVVDTPVKEEQEKQTDAPKLAGKPSRRQFLDTLAASLSPEGHDIALEREEHAYLFNLIGDPLLKISRPQTIEFDSPPSIRVGEPIVVAGTSPHAGRCEIEIVYPRKRVPDLAKKLRIEVQKATTGKLELQQKLFEAANTSVLSAEVIPSIHDTFRVKFDTNGFPTGQFEIRVSIYGEGQWSVRSIPVEIKK